MTAIRFRAGVLACICLLAIPLSSVAQTSSSSSAAFPDRATIAAVDSSSVPSLEELGLPAVPAQTTGQSGTASSAQNQQNPANQQSAPANNAPSDQAPANQAPSLSDLGFAASQTQGNAHEQAMLNKRTHMLKVHQTLGMITLVPMVATVVAGGGAKTKRRPGGTYIEPNSTNLDLHVALGAVTGGMYAATAYYAIFAPKIPGVKPKGAIRLHRDLEWVHGPGMIATGVLGILAYNQEKNGEKVHGIASAHGAVADVTVAAYAASIIAVSWPIHVKFWEKK